jgi:outer membrane protein OmpA-like peptidoglycan-associated protein
MTMRIPTSLSVLAMLVALACPASAAVDVDLGVLDDAAPKEAPKAAKPVPKAAKPAPKSAAKPATKSTSKPDAKSAAKSPTKKSQQARDTTPLRPRAPPAPPQLAPIPPAPPKAVAQPQTPATEPATPAAAAATAGTPAQAARPDSPPPAASEGTSRPPSVGAESGPMMSRGLHPAGSIAFAPAVAELPAGAGPELDQLAEKLTQDDHLHLQVVAFAEGNDASTARRLSLSRALAIRSYLLDRGVRAQKIEVRPLGNRPEAGDQPDHVDLVFAER